MDFSQFQGFTFDPEGNGAPVLTLGSQNSSVSASAFVLPLLDFEDAFADDGQAIGSRRFPPTPRRARTGWASARRCRERCTRALGATSTRTATFSMAGDGLIVFQVPYTYTISASLPEENGPGLSFGNASVGGVLPATKLLGDGSSESSTRVSKSIALFSAGDEGGDGSGFLTAALGVQDGDSGGLSLNLSAYAHSIELASGSPVPVPAALPLLAAGLLGLLGLSHGPWPSRHAARRALRTEGRRRDAGIARRARQVGHGPRRQRRCPRPEPGPSAGGAADACDAHSAPAGVANGSAVEPACESAQCSQPTALYAVCASGRSRAARAGPVARTGRGCGAGHARPTPDRMPAPGRTDAGPGLGRMAGGLYSQAEAGVAAGGCRSGGGRGKTRGA